MLKGGSVISVIAARHDDDDGIRRTRNLLETKIYSRNKTLAVLFVTYFGQLLKWIRPELQQMDQKTGKLITMCKDIHAREDVDRLYMSRKEVGRGLERIETSVDASM